jgi:hypothetical protein
MAHDVFISYASQDKPTADAVCARLEQLGIRCWIAPRDILPGRDWRSSIVEAIASARALVLMLSAEANASPQVPKEILQATQHSVPIITFRIEDVQPSGPLGYELNSIHWLDAVTRPLERHIETLAGTLQKLLAITPSPVEAAPARRVQRGTPTARMALVWVAVIVIVAGTAATSWWWFGGSRRQEAAVVSTPGPEPRRDPVPTVQPQPTPPSIPTGRAPSNPPSASPALPAPRVVPAPSQASRVPERSTPAQTVSQGESWRVLESLAGAYQADAITMTVALQSDGTLTLLFPGQPLYHLHPQGNLRFVIGELAGFAVAFERDGAGAIARMHVFQRPPQPNFTAIRVRDATPPSAASASVSPPPPPPANVSRSVSLTGCWQLAGAPGLLVFDPDGTFTSGGVLHGTWKAAGASEGRYELQFPDDVVHGQLSRDSRTITNVETPTITLSRVSGGPGLPGVWRYQSGVILTIEPGGVTRTGDLLGRWRVSDEASRIFEFHFPSARPTVTISGDVMTYVDPRQGAVLTLKRLSC